MNTLMGWLLKYDGYPPGIVFTALFHGGLLLFILSKDSEPAEYVNIDKPVFIQAIVTENNPQQLRKIEQNRLQQQQVEQRKQEQERQTAQKREKELAAQKVAQEVAQKKAAAETEQKRKLEADRVAKAKAKTEADNKAKATAEAEKKRLADIEKQRQSAAEVARQKEAQQKAQQQSQQQSQQNQAAETNLVNQYAAIIQRLIEQNWSIPPGARNDMLAVVELRLTPVGDITSHTIVRSSGNAAYDRSVLQAIDKVESFPELRDVPIAVFERNFRVFTLNFSPEDLLR